MKPKLYWFLSDGKTVKEVSREEYEKMFFHDLKSKGDKHLLVSVWDSEISFHKRSSIFVRREQLRQVLGEGESKQ